MYFKKSLARCMYNSCIFIVHCLKVLYVFSLWLWIGLCIKTKVSICFSA